MLSEYTSNAHERIPRVSTDDRVIMERDAADFLSVGQSTLQRWRQLGTGPKFIRISARRLGYRLSDLKSFLERFSIKEAHSLRPGRSWRIPVA
jgi:predicted DNA-binding transcriptional regulator AlpA